MIYMRAEREQTRSMSTPPLLSVPSLETLQKRTSQKWREFSHDILPLPVAEMDYEIALPIREKLISMISSSDTGYLGAVPELAESLAQFASTRWGWNVDKDAVFTATDVGVGMVAMGWSMRSTLMRSKELMRQVRKHISSAIPQIQSE